MSVTTTTPKPRRPKNSPELLFEAIRKQPLEVKISILKFLTESIENDKKDLEAKLNLINGK